MSNQGNIFVSGLVFLRQGRFKDLFIRVGRVAKKAAHFFIYQFKRVGAYSVDTKVELKTDFPIAFESPDHQHPHGTKDSFSSKIFILKLDKILRKKFPRPLKMLDLGCAGGKLVRDFKDLGYLAIGLEGSDYNLKRGLKEWGKLGNKNLFTCDITKPYKLSTKFNLITSWEVMEHMPTPALPQVFKNIVEHLETGGYFIASTAEFSDMSQGVELHLTQWTNKQWTDWIAANVPELKPVDLGLKYYEHVRYNLETLSILTYQKV